MCKTSFPNYICTVCVKSALHGPSIYLHFGDNKTPQWNIKSLLKYGQGTLTKPCHKSELASQKFNPHLDGDDVAEDSEDAERGGEHALDEELDDLVNLPVLRRRRRYRALLLHKLRLSHLEIDP